MRGKQNAPQIIDNVARAGGNPPDLKRPRPTPAELEGFVRAANVKYVVNYTYTDDNENVRTRTGGIEMCQGLFELFCQGLISDIDFTTLEEIDSSTANE